MKKYKTKFAYRSGNPIMLIDLKQRFSITKKVFLFPASKYDYIFQLFRANRLDRK